VLILAITKQPSSTRIGSPNGMSEYKIALFGSGGMREVGVEADGRGWQVFFDGTICVAYLDGTI